MKKENEKTRKIISTKYVEVISRPGIPISLEDTRLLLYIPQELAIKQYHARKKEILFCLIKYHFVLEILNSWF